MKKSRNILNIEKLYYGTREEVIEALKEKIIWLDNTFYIPGNLKTSKDELGKIHYDFIEAVYNSTLLFEDPTFESLLGDEEFKNKVHSLVNDFSVLKLFNEIDLSNDALFWCEYNFRLLELSQFNTLYPNFFPSISEDELKEFVDYKNPDICDAIKCLIFSKTLQNSIILSKSQLLNNNFPCKILTKIYVKEEAPSDLKESLFEVAQKNNVDLEEIK